VKGRRFRRRPVYVHRSIAAALTTRTQLKLEFLDAYASRPPLPQVKSNDTSLLASVVYKF
jgi:hypothetical protein